MIQIHISRTLPAQAHGPLPETVYELADGSAVDGFVDGLIAVRTWLSKGTRWHAWCAQWRCWVLTGEACK